ncbi:hypothetical protein T439DRAFT_381207 [Meredithblackwellia eburnea MCA 4105]
MRTRSRARVRATAAPTPQVKKESDEVVEEHARIDTTQEGEEEDMDTWMEKIKNDPDLRQAANHPPATPLSPYQLLTTRQQIEVMLPDVPAKFFPMVSDVATPPHINLSFNRQRLELPGNMQAVLNKGETKDGFDPSSRYLSVKPGWNIVPQSPGDPLVVFSSREELKRFVSCATRCSASGDAGEPHSINVIVRNGANDWRYKGSYSVQILNKVEPDHQLADPLEQFVGRTRVNFAGSSMRRDGVESLLREVETWGSRGKFYDENSFSSRNLRGAVEELENSKSKELSFIVFKWVGWDHVSLKVWEKRRRMRKNDKRANGRNVSKKRQGWKGGYSLRKRRRTR